MHKKTIENGRYLKALRYFVAVLLVSASATFAVEDPDRQWLTPELKQSLSEGQIQTIKHYCPKDRAEAIENAKNRSWVTEEVENMFGPAEIDIMLLLPSDKVKPLIDSRKSMSSEESRTWRMRNEGKLYDVWDVVIILGDESETEGMFDERIRASYESFMSFFGQDTCRPFDEVYVKAISNVLERTRPVKRQKMLNPRAGVIWMTQLEEFQRGVIWCLGRELRQRAENGLNPTLANWNVKGDSRECFYTLLNMLIAGSQRECQTDGDWFLREAYIQGVIGLRDAKWSASLERPEKLDNVGLIGLSDSIIFTKEYRDWRKERPERKPEVSRGVAQNGATPTEKASTAIPVLPPLTHISPDVSKAPEDTQPVDEGDGESRPLHLLYAIRGLCVAAAVFGVTMLIRRGRRK